MQGKVRRFARRPTGEVGMATAEYAMGTVAACGFAGVLYKVLTSDNVLSLLTGVIAKVFKLF